LDWCHLSDGVKISRAIRPRSGKAMDSRPVEYTPARQEPIAVIRAGCYLPGGVDSPDFLWRFLVEGRDGDRHRPPWDRLGVAGTRDGRALQSRGAQPTYGSPNSGRCATTWSDWPKITAQQE
jgi:hypothetical protein